MKRIVLLMSLIVLLFGSISLFAVEKVKEPVKTPINMEKEYIGMICDAQNGATGKLPAKPSWESLKAMNKVGYGIMMKDANGKMMFHKFDAKGNELVKSDIIAKATPKDKMMVSVKGMMDRNGTIAVKSIKMHTWSKPMGTPMKAESVKPTAGKK
jgi:hypothetical protein